MRAWKVLIPALAVVVVALAAAPVAQAQCATPESFASIGTAKTQVQVEVLAGVAQNTSNQIARLWDGSNSGINNGPGGALCPASAWWKLQTGGVVGTGPNRGINSSIGGTGCGMNLCPGGELVALVEDFGPLGPPGGGDTAFFIAWRVDADPTNAARFYNYARTNNLQAGNFPFLEFPRVNVTASGRNGMRVNITTNFVDVGPNHHGARAPGNTPIPPTDTILQLDVMKSTGLSDPGRLRTAWTQIATIPYSGAVSQFQANVTCDDVVNDSWVAVGITFKGGSGPNVQSALVGKAVALECNPNLADPTQLHRPQAQPMQPRKPQPLRGH